MSIAIGCNVIGRHNFLAHKLEAEIEYCICAIVMRITPLRSVAILPQICTVCTKLRKHVNAIMEVLYCFTVAIVLPGVASDYNEDNVGSCSQGQIQEGPLPQLPRLKPTKVALFNMILCNSKNTIVNIRLFCCLLFCRRSIVKYTSFPLNSSEAVMRFDYQIFMKLPTWHYWLDLPLVAAHMHNKLVVEWRKCES